MRFQDKACLVTGGASGIGKAFCQQVAAEGANVFLTDIQDAGAAVYLQDLNITPIVDLCYFTFLPESHCIALCWGGLGKIKERSLSF